MVSEQLFDHVDQSRPLGGTAQPARVGSAVSGRWHRSDPGKHCEAGYPRPRPCLTTPHSRTERWPAIMISGPFDESRAIRCRHGGREGGQTVSTNARGKWIAQGNGRNRPDCGFGRSVACSGIGYGHRTDSVAPGRADGRLAGGEGTAAAGGDRAATVGGTYVFRRNERSPCRKVSHKEPESRTSRRTRTTRTYSGRSSTWTSFATSASSTAPSTLRRNASTSSQPARVSGISTLQPIEREATLLN